MNQLMKNSHFQIKINDGGKRVWAKKNGKPLIFKTKKAADSYMRRHRYLKPEAVIIYTKLTPVYAVIYWLESSDHRFEVMEYGRGGHRTRVFGTFEEAVAKVDELRSEGFKARAYQYGWDERGFRPSDDLSQAKSYGDVA